MSPNDKPLVWLHGEVKTPPFSAQARLEAGYLLRLLQRGELVAMPHSRPMPSIGRRCHELRISDKSVSWRVVYRVDDDAIVIGEVFSKKTGRTPKSIIETCKERSDSMTVSKARKAKLEKNGWKVGSVPDFLQLTDEESAYVEMKLALSEKLRERRRKKKLTQAQFANLISSSQSRVAKMEAGDPAVTLDLLVKSLLALGVSKKELGRSLL